MVIAMRWRNSVGRRIRIGGTRLNDSECCCGCLACGCTLGNLPPEVTVSISGYRDYSSTPCSGCRTEIDGDYIFDLSSGPDATSLSTFPNQAFRCCWVFDTTWSSGGPCFRKAVVFSVQGSGLFATDGCQYETVQPAFQFEVQVSVWKTGEIVDLCLTPGGTSDDGRFRKLLATSGNCSDPFGEYARIALPPGVGDCDSSTATVIVS